jgi:hypothetical protein
MSLKQLAACRLGQHWTYVVSKPSKNRSNAFCTHVRQTTNRFRKIAADDGT